MKILIDGDACNVISCTEKIAKEKDIECHIFCDTSRILDSEYSQIHVVDKGFDSTDFAILNKCSNGDIIITKDGGLAAMVLTKNAYAISPQGFEYTRENIEIYLNRRYIRQHEVKRTKRNQVKGLINHEIERIPFNKLLRSIISKSNKRK